MNLEDGNAAFNRFLLNGLSVKGRASRSDYSWVVIVSAIFGAAVISLLTIFGSESWARNALFIVLSIFAAGQFIPFLTLSVRRLHDLGYSGFWLLLCVPLAIWQPWFLLAVLGGLCGLPASKGDNRFGPLPGDDGA